MASNRSTIFVTDQHVKQYSAGQLFHHKYIHPSQAYLIQKDFEICDYNFNRIFFYAFTEHDSSTLPPLPSAFATPIPQGVFEEKHPNNTLPILFILCIVFIALFFLGALIYFAWRLARGHCQDCSMKEDRIKQLATRLADKEVITPVMVLQRDTTHEQTANMEKSKRDFSQKTPGARPRSDPFICDQFVNIQSHFSAASTPTTSPPRTHVRSAGSLHRGARTVSENRASTYAKLGFGRTQSAFAQEDAREDVDRRRKKGQPRQLTASATFLHPRRAPVVPSLPHPPAAHLPYVPPDRPFRVVEAQVPLRNQHDVNPYAYRPSSAYVAEPVQLGRDDGGAMYEGEWSAAGAVVEEAWGKERGVEAYYAAGNEWDGEGTGRGKEGKKWGNF
ncbi:hypothetical protein N0V90_011323 [Kalmusia sp. IMI 367209]|nr:hypothetical protein N0V90_011323 [Kalmusia sp. IMI 367209]